MLGMRENVVDIPYDMITSVRLDKGGFSSNVIFKAPGLINSGRRGKLYKMMIGSYQHGDDGGEDGKITALPKDKAEDLVEVIRNGMDRDREATSQRQHSSEQPISVADELAKIAKLKEQGVISEFEFVQLKQNLLKRM